MNAPRFHSSIPNPSDYSPSEQAPLSHVTLRIPDEMGGLRLDHALARLMPEFSRSRLQEWVRAGRVRIGGSSVQPKLRLIGGEILEVAPERLGLETTSRPQDIPLAVVFEDDDLLVIDKPAGLVVHPGNGNWEGTMLNALLHRVPDLCNLPRAGIVHRLDKDTSGLLVVAKTLESQTDLVRQLQARTVRRQYLAVVRGIVPVDGFVEAAIGRHPVQRTRMAVVADGRAARTDYHVIERFAATTLVECRLHTGRTHQIRVHMAHIGHPLLGDPTYAGHRAAPLPFARQALHACQLGLLHPRIRQEVHWQSPLPADLAGLIERLRSGSTAP
jgi:23S rRNA pseudouridine1911/1915/1917 synthase